MPVKLQIGRMLAALLTLAAYSCASKPKEPVQIPIAEQNTADGLELRLWPIEDSQNSLARVLAPFERQDSPIDPRTLKRLKDSGLRAIVVPTTDLDAIAAALKIRGQAETQASRDRSEWSIFVASKGWQTYATIRSADGNLVLGGGQLRLLGRAWVAPGPFEHGTTPAVLRVEFMGRHLEQKDSAAKIEDALRPQLRRPLEEDGLPLKSLNASFELTRGQSLLLVPEYPDTDWGRDARLPNYIEKEPEKAAEEADAAQAAQGVGPIAPDVPTLGHALLSDALFGLKPKKRAILVLVPRLPQEFRLFR
ncbi:MAG: hypothetical protein ACREJD_04195 [Phycisphaerales bacterium]